MNFMFSHDHLTKIDALKLRYPSPQALCLPCLWMAQYQEGYISMSAIDTISEILNIPPMEVYRVATFYTMFHLEPQEKLNILVCKTLSCKLCGRDAILEHLKNKEVNIIHTECLGSCATAPVMQINDIYYENLTPEKVDAILKELL